MAVSSCASMERLWSGVCRYIAPDSLSLLVGLLSISFCIAALRPLKASMIGVSAALASETIEKKSKADRIILICITTPEASEYNAIGFLILALQQIVGERVQGVGFLSKDGQGGVRFLG